MSGTICWKAEGVAWWICSLGKSLGVSICSLGSWLKAPLRMGEINSVKITESLEAILKSRNIKLKKVSITGSNDIKSAMNKLVGSVDLIYLPQDNSVVSAQTLCCIFGQTLGQKLSEPAAPWVFGLGSGLGLGNRLRTQGTSWGNRFTTLHPRLFNRLSF